MKQRTIEDFYRVNPGCIEEILAHQIELLKLRKHIQETKQRVSILFEGRDAAEKEVRTFALLNS